MEETLQGPVHAPIIYPGVSARVKAIFTDSLILVVMMLVVSAIFSEFESVAEQLRIIAIVFILFLYDPLLTSFTGGTLGHRLMGLRVKDATDHKQNINFFKALIRFLLKATLAWISLLTVQGNAKGKAMHDMAVGSVVVFVE